MDLLRQDCDRREPQLVPRMIHVLQKGEPAFFRVPHPERPSRGNCEEF